MISLSLALNVLFGVAIYFSVKKSVLPNESVFIHPPAIVKTSSPDGIASLLPAVSFQWSQLVSDDLKTYRDNLRSIGCPEVTVREIIRAVINEQLGARRRDILASFQVGYWNLVAQGQLARRQWLPQSEWGQALVSLAVERQRLISDVLGFDDQTVEAERQRRQAEWEQELGWLPPEKEARMLELKEKYQEQLDEWAVTMASHDGAPPTAADQERLQNIKQAFEDAERQLLTHAEMAEVQLGESDVAGWAASLPGFNPTAEEWQSLTALRSQLEQSVSALSDPNLSDQQRLSQQNELQTNFENAVAFTLSPDRLAQYQLANNNQYQSIHNVTQRYGLPDSVAVQSLDVEETAQAAVEQVRANTTLSSADQQAALSSIQQATEQALGTILGPNVLYTYQEYGGDWITGLNQVNDP
jgi:hypothetical protein